jgi:hypothetical protein
MPFRFGNTTVEVPQIDRFPPLLEQNIVFDLGGPILRAVHPTEQKRFSDGRVNGEKIAAGKAFVRSICPN